MANKTINDLTVTTSAAASDLVPIWRAANSDTRHITKANFMGGVLTGGGTLATGGFTLTVGGTSTINGSLVGNMTGGGTLATGGFTLTVPATGTASLLGTAQTYSALKTFSAGISLGNETLSVYDQGTWTPFLISSGGDFTVSSYSTQTGQYTRIGNVVYFVATVQPASISLTDGTAVRITLPLVAAQNAVAAVYYGGPDVPAGVIGSVFQIFSGQQYGQILFMYDALGGDYMVDTAIATSNLIITSGFYHV